MSSTQQFGVTPNGFVAKQQQQIIADINTALQAAFGANINLGAESVFGQLVGVFSEREALLWALAEAVYASQYPSGAEGTSVDNILALNNLTRLPATATVTNPTPTAQTNGIVLYGLVLYGTPGTVVPAGSQVRSTTTPSLTFTLDANVTINAAVSSEQNVVLSNSPTSGSFALALVDAPGNKLTTGAMPYNTRDAQTALTWFTPPVNGQMVLMLGNQVVPPFDANYSAAGVQVLLDALGGTYGSVAVAGNFTSGMLLQWGSAIFNPMVNAAPTLLVFSGAPTAGAFTLALNGVTTASLAFGASAAQVQTAIQGAGFPRALVGAVVPGPKNLLPGNVRTGTDAGQSTNGFIACLLDAGFATSSSPTLASSTDFAWEQSRSLLITAGESGRGAAGVRVVVTPGVTYTFSVYARAHDAGAFSVSPAAFYNAAGGSIGSPVSINNTSWTRISQTFTVPGGQSSVQLMVGGTGLLFYSDGWQLEVGASATAWADTAGVGGFAINFVGTPAPAVTVPTNTLSNTGGAVSVTPSSGYTMDQPVVVAQSMQAMISNLYDAATGKRPFTDVQVNASGSLFVVDFGANTPQAGEPSSGSMPQPTMTVPQNSLQSSGSITNVAVAVVDQGAPAQGTGTATCTTKGPNTVLAGQLSIIGSATSGWTAVTNQLDAIQGTNVETDTEALIRRSALAASQAKGPLQGIVERVLQVPGVTGAIGFQNTTAAALQVLSFASIPTSGSFQLVVGGGTTAPIGWGAAAADIQTAINAIPGYGQTTVAGGMALGFIIDFNGSSGAQGQPLTQVVSNTTGIAAAVGYGRAPKSIEIVVQGGSASAIAQTIYGSMPAGIASYGSPAAQVLGTMTQASNVLTVSSAAGIAVGQAIYGLGIPSNATVGAISGTSVTMSAAALGTYSNTPVLFNYGAHVTDAYGNPVIINFSRPTPVLFYVNVALVTDQYRTPGAPSSGVNPLSKFQPGSIAQIQADIAAIGNKTPIGGLVVGFGTNGLIGAFNEVPGVVGYTVTFGVAPSPVTSANVQLLPTQIATFQVFNIQVSWT